MDATRTSYTWRWDFADGNGTLSGMATVPPKTLAQNPLIVIDWVYIVFGSTAGGVCTFQLIHAGAKEVNYATPPALAGVLLNISVDIEAGSQDTVWLPFTGGYPLRATSSIEDLTVVGGVSESIYGGNTLYGPPVALTSVQWNFAGATDSGNVWIGFHTEPGGARG